MAKQAPKTKFLQVPDCPSKKEFLSASRQVWKEHHPEGCGQVGHPGEARRLFELCDRVARTLMKDRAREVNQYHRREHTGDKDELFLWLTDCPTCSKNFPLISRKKFREAIQQYLKGQDERLSAKARKNQVALPHQESYTDKTLDSYIWNWFRFKLHPQWMEKDIPKTYRPLSGDYNYKTRFNHGQIAEHARRKKEYQAPIDKVMASNLPDIEKAEEMGSQAYTLELNKNEILFHFRVPPELRPPE